MSEEEKAAKNHEDKRGQGDSTAQRPDSRYARYEQGMFVAHVSLVCICSKSAYEMISKTGKDRSFLSTQAFNVPLDPTIDVDCVLALINCIL